MARANQSITERLPVVGLLILSLLIGQFNSVRRTAIILVTIPLGVVAGLILAQSYVRFMTLLGIVALAGIIINHGIVLIDRIRIEIDDNGLDPPRAIVESAQSRFSQWSRLPLVRILNEGNRRPPTAPASCGRTVRGRCSRRYRSRSPSCCRSAPAFCSAASCSSSPSILDTTPPTCSPLESATPASTTRSSPGP